MAVENGKGPIVYCKDCVRWYCTGADQCEVPDCGFEETSEDFRRAVGPIGSSGYDQEGLEFLKTHLERILKSSSGQVFGHPSQLNKNNDCYFHKPLPTPFSWATAIARFFHHA